MEVRKSLLEILDLSERDKEAATNVARSVVVPWNSEHFPEDMVDDNYYPNVSLPYEKLTTMPEPEFIFDRLGHFFRHHRDGQLSSSRRGKPVLSNQPDEELTSIVIGRLPVWRNDGEYSVVRFGNGILKYDHDVASNLAYVYIESGTTRRPHFSYNPFRGNVRLSENRPLSYVSVPFPEGALVIQKTGFHEEIDLIVPLGLRPRQYRPQ